MIRIGIVREAKAPFERRAPLSPEDCAWLIENSPVEILMQPAESRCFSDQEYRDVGVILTEDLSGCDWILGVKELDPEKLIAGKSYMCFAHVIKEQPFNRDLLRSALSQKVRLVDYESLKGDKGKRVIGFGRYAGIVGAYNALHFYKVRQGDSRAQRAFDAKSLQDLIQQAKQYEGIDQCRIVVTGKGRVGKGVAELFNAIGLVELTPSEFLSNGGPGWVNLSRSDYMMNKGGNTVRSGIEQYLSTADIYIAAHFWQQGSPKILRRDQLSLCGRLSIISDISCDIHGGVETTDRATSIANPIYYLDDDPEGIWVTSIDNLPCEIPKTATKGFGKQLSREILPLIWNGDRNGLLAGATITEQGQLTPSFDYLKSYAGVV